MINIRPASLADVTAITNIYNEAVINSTGTFDTEIKSIEDRTEWFLDREPQFMIIVAELEKKVVGYLALNKWSDRKAYDITAEVSFYVLEIYRGRGIGKLLLGAAINMARETKLNSLISRISEGNENSIHLHKINGFETIGVMKEAGIKFNRLLNVTLMQKMLKRNKAA
jgi:L-amino acid N-acyltransferase YncA